MMLRLLNIRFHNFIILNYMLAITFLQLCLVCSLYGFFFPYVLQALFRFLIVSVNAAAVNKIKSNFWSLMEALISSLNSMVSLLYIIIVGLVHACKF